MNSINTDENTRPFGFWLKAVDRLMTIELATAFESEGITRREWRLLNIVDGTVPAHRRRDDRPLPAHKLGRLIELGWVTDAEGTWTLTDEGRAAKEHLGGIVEGIRAKVTDAVPTEDLATTMATLEQLARAFGWDDETPLPRGPRGGFGRRSFGRHSFGVPGISGREGCRHGEHNLNPEGRDHDVHGHEDHAHRGGPHGHRGHGGGRGAHIAQGAYERGFDAGFTRARDDR